jgi:hypothetical protein
MGDSTHEGLKWYDPSVEHTECVTFMMDGHRMVAQVWKRENFEVYMNDGQPYGWRCTANVNNLAEAQRYAEVTYLLTR